MTKTLFRFLMFAALAFVSSNSYSGNASGQLGNVLVGRLGTQVFVQVTTSTYSGWPCSGANPVGAQWQYAFLLTQAGANQMLATILAAQVSGKSLEVVGTGACTVDPTMEDVSYVVLLP